MQKKKGNKEQIKGFRSVGETLMLMNIALVTAVSVIVGVIAIFALRTSFTSSMDVYESAKLEGYKQEIVSETQSAISMVQMEYDKYKKGEMTEDEAKERAREDIRYFRYRDDQSGYFWIDDLDYNLVMHPILTDQEGTNRKDLKDQKGNMIIQMIHKSCTSAKKGGFNEFYFTKADGKTVAPKLAYSQLFEPWGWMLSTGNYTDDMNKEMASTRASLTANQRASFIEMIIVMAACIVIASLLSFRYGKKLIAPLKKIRKFADQMASGNLKQGIEVTSKNEFGATGRELNAAQHKIGSMISKATASRDALENSINVFSDNFGSMTDAISNVSKAVNDIAQNNTEQAKSASDAAESVQTLSSGIDDSSANVAQLDKDANEMMEYSKQSRETLRQLVEKNDATMQDISTMSEQTQQTSDSVAKIAEAANLISEIASQTSLLSLNASIEAARAGEQGRGFAVVAEEIGHLADQSDESAKTINTIVTELVNNSTKQVEIMKRMQDVSNEQVRAFGTTRDTFDKLESSLDECFKSVEAISADMKTMEEERDRIRTNIESLNDAATDNAASTEETSSMASELDTIVDQSKKLVTDLETHLKDLTDAMSIFTI